MFARVRVMLALLAGLALALPARAETELSFYSGLSWPLASTVSGNDPGGAGSFSFLSDWQTRGFDAPNLGLRGTWWTNRNPNLGFGLDLSQTRVYGDSASLAANGFTRLDFGDGLNTVTANVWYRWPGLFGDGRFTPYVGAGAGLSVPNVTVETASGTTSGYQVSGVAAQAVAGITYSLNENWSIFGEYKGSYSQNDIGLTGGGALSSDVTSGSINFGVSFSF